MLTGATGNGKSAACNFFMQKEVFESRPSFFSVTKETESEVATIDGKRIELVDTPGFLDPSSVEEDDERLKFARSLIKLKCGFHMLGLVFNITKRVEKGEDKVFANLLSTYSDCLPYVVLIFTHGKHLGNTEDDQKSALKGMIKEIEKQEMSNIKQLFKKINYRYIILESVKPMERGYHAKKSKELIEKVDIVFKQTRKPATNKFALSIAKQLREVEVDQTKLEEELADRIKIAQEMAKKAKDKSGASNFYAYLGYSVLISGGIIAAVMSGPAVIEALDNITPTLIDRGVNVALPVIINAKTCIFQ